jgi:hypothetical protein
MEEPVRGSSRRVKVEGVDVDTGTCVRVTKQAGIFSVVLSFRDPCMQEANDEQTNTLLIQDRAVLIEAINVNIIDL